MISTTPTYQATRDLLDRVAIAQAIRLNVQRCRGQVVSRLPGDAEAIAQALELLDEAQLQLSIWIDQESGGLLE